MHVNISYFFPCPCILSGQEWMVCKNDGANTFLCLDLDFDPPNGMPLIIVIKLVHLPGVKLPQNPGLKFNKTHVNLSLATTCPWIRLSTLACPPLVHVSACPPKPCLSLVHEAASPLKPCPSFVHESTCLPKTCPPLVNESACLPKTCPSLVYGSACPSVRLCLVHQLFMNLSVFLRLFRHLSMNPPVRLCLVHQLSMNPPFCLRLVQCPSLLHESSCPP